MDYFIINENNALNLLELSFYLAAPINIPLCFLRTLIILTAISPLLYTGVKYLKRWGIVILLAAFTLNIETLPGINVKGLFFFMLGCYLVVNKLDILDTFKNCKWIIYTIYGITTSTSIPIDNTPISTSIRHIYQVTTIIAVFLITNTIIKKLKYINQFNFLYSNVPFFIYAIHTIPIVVASPRGFANFLIDKILIIRFIWGARLLLNSIFMSHYMHYNILKR